MKIREVMEQTGLTDRAIRLYMEHGLIRPAYSSSYSGRRSITFSEEDVALLQKVALLRKAGFSLDEIKSIEESGENVRDTLQAYIDKISKEITHRQTILEALQPLADREHLTMNDICAQISDALSDEKVPAEDLRPTKAERVEAMIFRALAVILCLLSMVALVYQYLYFRKTFLYPRLYGLTTVIYAALEGIPLICALVLFRLYTGKKRQDNPERRMKAINLSVLTFLYTIFFLPFVLSMSTGIPPVYSQTENPANYLRMDDGVQYSSNFRYYVEHLFPPVMPYAAASDSLLSRFADSTKYYYRYETMFDPSCEIVAEWAFPLWEDYAGAKQTVQENMSDWRCKTVTKGDWTCLYFGKMNIAWQPTDSGEYDADGSVYGTRFLIFAYHDKEHKVRYIYSDTPGREANPHYLKLDW